MYEYSIRPQYVDIPHVDLTVFQEQPDCLMEPDRVGKLKSGKTILPNEIQIIKTISKPEHKQRMTDRQRQMLMEYFVRNKNPDRHLRREIRYVTNLSAKQISNWFSHHRGKERRINKL